MTPDKLPEKETQVKIRPVRVEDLPAIEAILRQWVRDPESGEIITKEVQEVIANITSFLDGSSTRNYLVAESADTQVLGMAGVDEPTPKILQIAKSKNPLELINLYIDTNYRVGKGIGTALYNAVKNQARADGYTELMLNSGPRYKQSGWGFYQKIIGDPIGELKNYYGPGDNAPVWSESLI